jgi:hypothetical protein
MEAEYSSETLMFIFKTAQYHKPVEHKLNTRRRENLKSYVNL